MRWHLKCILKEKQDWIGRQAGQGDSSELLCKGPKMQRNMLFAESGWQAPLLVSVYVNPMHPLRSNTSPLYGRGCPRPLQNTLASSGNNPKDLFVYM